MAAWFKMSMSRRCRTPRAIDAKGIKVSDAEMAKLNITRAEFHGEWNYTIKPRRARKWRCYFVSGPKFDLSPYRHVLGLRKRVGARPAVKATLDTEGLTSWVAWWGLVNGLRGQGILTFLVEVVEAGRSIDGCVDTPLLW
jgi:hypothetical protein